MRVQEERKMTSFLKLGLTPLSALDARRCISLAEASRLTNLSRETLKRRHADKIVQLSERRVGMRLGDVLAIGTPRD
jgi:hypothetical protein